MTENTLHIPVHFILLLICLFVTAAILTVIYHCYKAQRRRRLTSPRKDYIRK